MRLSCRLFTLAALLFTVPVCAQEVPDSAAVGVTALGEQFVKAVRDTSSAFRLQTARIIYAPATLKRVSADKLVGLFEQLRIEYGQLEYHHSELTHYVLHVYARSPLREKWLDIQARIEHEAPYKILQVVFIAEVAEPVYLPNGPIQSPDVLTWLNSYVDKLVSDDDLSGSVLIAQGDSAIFERTFGFADPARTREINPVTRFNLGSGNKMFTALGIMLLAAERKLSLDDSVSKYFKDFPYPDFAHRATIRHLLTHTSGLGDFWTDDYEKHWDKISTLRQILPFVYADSVHFNPGDSFQYSNSGYILLGLIIERVSGMDYFKFVRTRIYEPLGMTHSDSYLQNDADTTLALPLTRQGKRWQVAPHGLRGSSAGGGYSTCRDMLLFIRGLLSYKIVDRATLKEMTTPMSSSRGKNFDYGYGFMIWRSESNVVSYGHAGQTYGVNFELRYYPQKDLTTVLLCNQDNGAFDSLRHNIEKLVTGDR